jgi:hypothetical protein
MKKIYIYMQCILEEEELEEGQTLNINPIMHYQAKTSQPDGKIRN